MYRERSVIGIGWHEVADLSVLPATREAYKAEVSGKIPALSRGAMINGASQLYRFVCEMQVGDWIVYRSRFDNQVHVGKISGPYEYNPTLSTEYPQTRTVRWLGAFSPTKVSQGALYELGSALTLFQLKNYGDEYIAALEGRSSSLDETDDESVAAVATEVELTTGDFILKQLARHLKGHGLQNFVADLLKTMGYRTIQSRPGPDEGVDIIAHRDELKLEPPIIKVQVKSGVGNVGRETAQALLGTLSNGEFGLLVTIGGFTPQALDFARNKSTIRLLDGPALVELILAHYESLEQNFKSIIPLKRVYVPQPATSLEDSTNSL